MTERLLAPPSPAQDTVAGVSRRRWPVRAGVALLAMLGGLHMWATWSTYHVGSFDDDGHFIALARAMASGQGFVDTSLPGDPVELNRTPGGALLFAPLAAVSPDTTWQFQLLSMVAFLACFPLAWHWMRLRGVGPAAGLMVLALFAMSPLAATYGVMVMVEMPFLVTLLAMLIALHHWDRQDRVVTRWGLAAVFLLIWLLALKSAALAFYPGVLGYLLVRRWFRKATLAGIAGLLVLLPVAANRVLHGASPLGERNAGYFEEYAGHPLVHFLQVLPQRAYDFIVYVLPNSIAQLGHLPPWPQPVPDLAFGLRFVFAALVVIGFVVWHRYRGLDATLVIVPIYLAQSLSYPFINQRRVILIFPLVLLWLVVGALATGEGSARLWRATRRRRAAAASAAGAGGRRPTAAAISLGLCAIVILPALGLQFGRNYRLAVGEETAKPQGSSYVRTLRAITEPNEDIASSYRWTIAAFTGRDTLHDVQFYPCTRPSAYEDYAPKKLGLLRQHTYGAALFGTLNWPWSFDDSCTLSILQRHPAWAVRIHRQPRDKAVVFQLIGPGTANPDLSDVTLGQPAQVRGGRVHEATEPPYVEGERSGTYHVLEPADASDQAILTVPFDRAVPVTQVSLGAAGQRGGAAARSIAVELRGTDGGWSRVWGVEGADVDTREPGPDVVVRGFRAPRTATAVRVVFRGGGPFEVHDLHVLARTGHRGEPALK